MPDYHSGDLTQTHTRRLACTSIVSWFWCWKSRKSSPLAPHTTASGPWHRSTNQLGCTSQQHDGIWPLDTEGFALGPVGSARCKLHLATTVGSGHLTQSLCTKCSCITTLSNKNRYAKGSPPVVSTPDHRTHRKMLCLAVLLP
jgi:hypothetical protein